jgi:hypothetical protein
MSKLTCPHCDGAGCENCYTSGQIEMEVTD